MNTDVIIACADLIDRAGGKGMSLGYTGDPEGPAANAGWYAYAEYQGARITVEDHASPSAAAHALAERILTGATCRYGQPATLSDTTPGCRWTLQGKRWEPGCDVPPVRVSGIKRGDHAAMARALRERRQGR